MRPFYKKIFVKTRFYVCVYLVIANGVQTIRPYSGLWAVTIRLDDDERRTKATSTFWHGQPNSY